MQGEGVDVAAGGGVVARAVVEHPDDLWKGSVRLEKKKKKKKKKSD